jgi:hypothetical protein
VDLPEVKGCVERVWDEHTREVHHSLLADDHSVCGDPPGSHRMQAQGKQKRGAMPHHWWWEQLMDLDINDAIGSDT